MTTLQKIIKYCAIAFAIFLIVSIASGILGAFGVLAGISARDDAVTADPVDRDFGPYNETVRDLDMDIGGADIRILRGDALRAETDNPYIRAEVKNGTLIIREDSHIADLEGSTLTLYIPDDQTFEEVDIVTGAGVIRTEALTCRELDLQLGAGKAELSDLTVTGDADISGGAGQFIIHSGAVHNLDFDMGVGEAEITAELTGDIEVSAGVGALRMNVQGSREDYTIRTERGLGRIVIDGSDDFANSGNGQHRMDLEGGIGDIQVEFHN